MKIGFIGAGKVGTTLGYYWMKKEFPIVGYYSRTLDSAKKAASKTNSRAFTDLTSLAEEADLILITTPDDSIKIAANHLSKINLDFTQKIIGHTSGALSSDILHILREKGAAVCSLHPMLSFADVNTSVKALEHTFFTLEGQGSGLLDLTALLNDIGHKYIEISTEQKTLYHASACVVSNYLVTLLDTGIKMLCDAGFSQETARMLITPLVQKTVENVLTVGTKEALTGPISRGDTGTIQKHMETLKQYKDENWLNIYQVLGKQTVALAEEAGKINTQTAQGLYKELNQYEQ